MNSSIMTVGVRILCLTLGLSGVRSILNLPLTLSPGTSDLDWEDPSPEEGPFLEGDIITGSETIPVVEFKSTHRNLVANPRLLWPQKTLYYEFSSGQFVGELRTLVEEALKDIMEHSCVRFSPRGQQTTYLKLKGTGKGCNSKVGYPEEEGPLTLQVAGRKCHTLGTVQHEFLHALGLWHEHTRADRDHYVTVVWENVRPDRKNNFVKRSDKESEELLKLPYDYGSIMHYKTSSFTKHRGSSTLVPKHKEAVKVMGQRVGITKGDIAKLNRLYNCKEEYYTGGDLEGKKFLFGQYYKSRVNRTLGDLEEESEYGEDIRSKKEANGITEDTSKQEVSTEEEIELRTRNTNKSYQSNVKYLYKEEKKQVIEIEKHKFHSFKEVANEMRSEPSKYIEGHSSNNSTGTHINQNKINVNTSKRTIDTLFPYLKIIVSDESLVKIMMIKDMLSMKKEAYKNDMRSKRETAGIKPQRDENLEESKQQSNENHESFAPQKILPELLKGVLNTENDRPIVIQFAIYQPIVYKNSNQSESSIEDNKGVSASNDERRKYNRGDVNEKTGYEARNSESKSDDNEQRIEKKPVKSFQKAQDLDHHLDDSSRFLNKKPFPEHDDEDEQQEDDDRIDVRSYNDRRIEPREQTGEINKKTDYNYNPPTRPTKSRDEHYPEHQTEYIPLSEDHKITVSKKEYTVSPHDFNVKGQEVRVSQTDYKIEPKVSRNHNEEFTLNVGHSPQSEVIVNTPEVDDFISDDVVNHEPSYFHEGTEYPDHFPEKANIQPLRASHRESGYDSSSLINFSQGKGTKSTYGHDNSNIFHHELNGERLLYNSREEGSFPPKPSLEQKKDHQEYYGSSNYSQDRSHKVLNTKGDDIAPNFHEPSPDDHILQPTTSENPTNYDEESHDDNVHDIIDHHLPSGGGPVHLESHKKNKNAEESIAYESNSSDIVLGTHTSTKINTREDTLDQTTVKDRKEDNDPYENKSIERSKETKERENDEQITVKKLSIIRDEELLSFDNRNQETSSGDVGKTSNSAKKRTRPDIVTNENFSTELDIGERRKKPAKMDQKTDDTSKTGHSKTQGSAVPNNRGNIRNNKNRIQSNVKGTVVRKKSPNTQIEPEEQQDFFNEEDLISKPQSSKLNLNPRQALPLKTFVNMGKTTFKNIVT